MTVMEAIKSRRTIRSYTGESITPQQLQTVLTAAQAAPVGMGDYTGVRLTVVTDQGLLGRINAAASKMSGRDTPALYGAPTLVLVSVPLSGTNADNVPYSNAACIVENMALAATSLGVGVCHIWGAVRALVADPSLVAELKLPEGFAPVCGVVLGKTDEVYAERDIPADRIPVNTI